jgi:hypothetical protein
VARSAPARLCSSARFEIAAGDVEDHRLVAEGQFGAHDAPADGGVGRVHPVAAQAAAVDQRDLGAGAGPDGVGDQVADRGLADCAPAPERLSSSVSVVPMRCSRSLAIVAS